MSSKVTAKSLRWSPSTWYHTHETCWILRVFSQFLCNLTFIFSGFHEKLSLVLLQITNYICRLALEKCREKNAILFKLFWYKVFVYWKLKLLNFLVDSVLKVNSEVLSQGKNLELNFLLQYKICDKHHSSSNINLLEGFILLALNIDMQLIISCLQNLFWMSRKGDCPLSDSICGVEHVVVLHVSLLSV